MPVRQGGCCENIEGSAGGKQPNRRPRASYSRNKVAVVEHTFSVEMAVRFGVAAAAIYRNFQFWISKNLADGRHFHDGRTWTYHTIRGLADLFPYLTVWEVRAGVNKLIKAGIIQKGNFNRQGYDRTTWYAFENEKEALQGLPSHLWETQMGSQAKTPICGRHKSICVTHKPIPDNNPDILSDKEKQDLSSADAGAESRQLLIQEGVHPKVAASIVDEQKHPPASIEAAVKNAHSRRVWLAITDPLRSELFKIPGYIVQTLNSARNESHTVPLSKRTQAIAQLAQNYQVRNKGRPPPQEMKRRANKQKQALSAGAIT